MNVVTSQSGISFDEALAAACDGAITPESARTLIRARDGDETISLLKAATELRDRLKGRAITYSKKVFIPLTNLCRDYCGYCTFRKDPGQVGAHTMTPDEFSKRLRCCLMRTPA
jgi:FO synthase